MNPFPAMLNCQLLLFLYFIAARFIKLYIVFIGEQKIEAKELGARDTITQLKASQ